MKYYSIFIDGIDKTGKDLIQAYIDILSNHRFLVKSRGVLSLIAYSNLYNRNYKYELENERDSVNVLLTVDKLDWLTRCEINRETKIDYEENCKKFEEAYQLLSKYSNNILTYNTSKLTPFEISISIIKYMEEINNEKIL